MPSIKALIAKYEKGVADAERNVWQAQHEAEQAAEQQKKNYSTKPTETPANTEVDDYAPNSKADRPLGILSVETAVDRVGQHRQVPRKHRTDIVWVPT